MNRTFLRPSTPMARNPYSRRSKLYNCLNDRKVPQCATPYFLLPCFLVQLLQGTTPASTHGCNYIYIMQSIELWARTPKEQVNFQAPTYKSLERICRNEDTPSMRAQWVFNHQCYYTWPEKGSIPSISLPQTFPIWWSILPRKKPTATC